MTRRSCALPAPDLPMAMRSAPVSSQSPAAGASMRLFGTIGRASKPTTAGVLPAGRRKALGRRRMQLWRSAGSRSARAARACAAGRPSVSGRSAKPRHRRATLAGAVSRACSARRARRPPGRRCACARESGRPEPGRSAPRRCRRADRDLRAGADLAGRVDRAPRPARGFPATRCAGAASPTASWARESGATMRRQASDRGAPRTGRPGRSRTRRAGTGCRGTPGRPGPAACARRRGSRHGGRSAGRACRRRFADALGGAPRGQLGTWVAPPQGWMRSPWPCSRLAEGAPGVDADRPAGPGRRGRRPGA